MNKKSWLMLVGGVLLLFFLLIIGKQLLSPNPAAALSKEEALKIVENKYPGQIKNVVQDNQQFVVDVEREAGVYQVILDEKDGAVLSVTKIKAYEIAEKPPETENEKTEEPANPQGTPQKILTEQDAMGIALKQVPGTIDDVELENRDGILHYFIEVEADNGEEALIEINSITGEVKSITWED